MTDPVEQVKEVALKISDLIYCPDYGRHRETERHDRFIADVSALVREYGEACELKAKASYEHELHLAHRIVDGVEKVNDHILEVAAEARRSALEEAAKVAENHELDTADDVCVRDKSAVFDSWERIADKIRTLIEK